MRLVWLLAHDEPLSQVPRSQKGAGVRGRGPSLIRIDGKSAGDVRRVAEMLARAFQDDPLMRYGIPNAEERRRLLPGIIGHNVRYGYRYGEVYATDDYAGAAIWLPPNQPRFTLGRMMRAGMFTALLQVGWPILGRMAAGEGRAGALHGRCMSGPHWYLSQIGVEPSRQRQGVASRLLRPILARADAAALPCYLETENAANIPFYERHGFQVAAEDAVPAGGPHIWAMVRGPSSH